MNSLFLRVTSWLLVAFVQLHIHVPASADWPYWRGPKFDGTAQAKGLPADWDSRGGEGSNVVWKRDDIGGPCTPVIHDGRLYTIQRYMPNTPTEGEQVVCLDAATGETLWAHHFNVWLSDVPAERVGWSSPAVDPDTGRVYALGSCDIFHCLDGQTGEVIWKRPLHEQFGMLSTYGGRTNFPIIHEDLVVISGIIINWGDAAKPNHRLIAMDKNTGEVRWFSGTRDLPYDTTYSAPSLVTINGQRQLVMGAGDGAIWGFQPRTGRPLWHYDLSRRGIFATPLVVGDRVFASHSEENVAPNENVMGGVVGLRISGVGGDTEVSELWKRLEVVAGYSEPVLVGERLYLVDDRCKMWIFDAESGEAIVERKSFVGSRQRAALLHADGKIYVLTENGRWAVIEPTADGFEVLNKGRVRDTGFAGSPIVSDGRLYFPSTNALYCVATGSGTEMSIDMTAAMGTETDPSDHSEAAWLQLTPAESLMEPGQSLELSVNVFNDLGQVLSSNTEATFTVDGPGEIKPSDASDGAKYVYVAPTDVAHTAATITATAGDVTGTARVRIVPPLPWKFTFEDLSDPPLSWVGARYRHVIRPLDGSKVLTKVNTIPKGARSRAWMGPSDLTNYTIMADVRGSRMSDQLPDIGLTNLGYVLDLMGSSQQLQIRTWSAQLRMAETVDFPWKEDTWYRMKFESSVQSDPAIAILRGKVWPRDEPEPTRWTIEATDASPNRSASPGLYGNAKVAELYYDNIEVVAND